MTLLELLKTYNFHDCDIITPFKLDDCLISIRFLLAKHIQFDDIKAKYKDYIADKNQNLIVKVRFIANEAPSLKEYKYNSKIEKQLTLDQFDNEWDFHYFDENDECEINLLFEINKKKYCILSFISDNVEIEDEFIIDDEGLDSMYDAYQ